LGSTTNNVAEYTAAINALAKLKAILGPNAAQAQVTVKSDSELMVKQVNRLYKVKDQQLAQLFIRLHNARQDFAKVDFVHIRREQNAVADGAVNAALDAQLSS
jgi:ribonuclease HI